MSRPSALAENWLSTGTHGDGGCEPPASSRKPSARSTIPDSHTQAGAGEIDDGVEEMYFIVPIQAHALHLLGEIAARREPPQSHQAETHYRQALTLAAALGMRPLQAHCHRGLGRLYVTTGQREQARAELSAAIAMYQSMDMTFWLPETAATLAQMEGH